MHAHTHTHTHTQACTHRNTHTHTHTHVDTQSHYYRANFKSIRSVYPAIILTAQQARTHLKSGVINPGKLFLVCVCVCVCLPACITLSVSAVCLSVCLSIWLSRCLSVCLFVCLRACLHFCSPSTCTRTPTTYIYIYNNNIPIHRLLSVSVNCQSLIILTLAIQNYSKTSLNLPPWLGPPGQSVIYS